MIPYSAPFEVTPYQIVVPLFSLLMLVYAWSLVMRQRKTIWEGTLWTVFWGALAYIALFPGNLQYLSAATGIKKNENAAVISALGVLFFIVFYMVIRIEELEQRITKVIRDKALQNADLTDKPADPQA
ncbi:MAG TPA: DUF2304 domain-containing protein [Candidatus Peribacteria bacterium]|nr:DUF2304 domain-containing protein [Candidatus Peribacteria bacterium]